MTWIDWAIVVVLAAAVIGGLTQGLFRSVFSLLGLIFGLVLAAWNYGRVAALVQPLVRVEAIADAIGFVVIALLVMAIANLIGTVLAKTLHRIGLGCLDSLAGGLFGFLQGTLLVTLAILVVLAFFPKEHWLEEAKLPKLFFGVCHLSTKVSPGDLSHRVHEGLRMMEEHAPEWMHPTTGQV
jgi:membrane protein required for colicin V production